MWEQLKQWDRELFVYLNGLGVNGFDVFWVQVTQEETWIPLYLLIIFLIFSAVSRKKAWIITGGYILSFLISFGLTRIIKASVARIRPNNVIELQEVIRILQEPTYYSFVSGHTSTSVAIVTYITLTLRQHYQWIYILYIWPLLFAFSRIYVGVHYPSDLIAGAILGILVAYLLYTITKRVSEKENKLL